MNFATASARIKWPSSTSAMMPTDTIGLVIEKMRKIESCAIGAVPVGLCLPSASNQPTWPCRATSTVTPGMVPLSISRLKASDMAWRRGRDSPSVSGRDSGRGGVFGAVEGRWAAVADAWAVDAWADMGTPGGLLLFGADCGPEGAAQTSEASALHPCNPALQSGRPLCFKA